MLETYLNKIENAEDTWFSKIGQGCIDTIFYSRNIKAIRTETIETDYSDHYAVYTEFEI